jgi:phosphosulfolactate synthase (CoM biosynthesis protein A)
MPIARGIEGAAMRRPPRTFREAPAGLPWQIAWYVKNYGPEVNLFVDHSQIVQLECLRSGIWGSKSLWGRVLTYKDE